MGATRGDIYQILVFVNIIFMALSFVIATAIADEDSGIPPIVTLFGWVFSPIIGAITALILLPLVPYNEEGRGFDAFISLGSLGILPFWVFLVIAFDGSTEKPHDPPTRSDQPSEDDEWNPYA